MADSRDGGPAPGAQNMELFPGLAPDHAPRRRRTAAVQMSQYWHPKAHAARIRRHLRALGLERAIRVDVLGVWNGGIGLEHACGAAGQIGFGDCWRLSDDGLVVMRRGAGIPAAKWTAGGVREIG